MELKWVWSQIGLNPISAKPYQPPSKYMGMVLACPCLALVVSKATWLPNQERMNLYIYKHSPHSSAFPSQVLHLDADGCADLEKEVPMRTDTIVRIYCMTKSIVGVALMLLVEQGKCALEDLLRSEVDQLCFCFLSAGGWWERGLRPRTIPRGSGSKVGVCCR